MALTAKQLEERQHYIGGSDVGAILGFNKFKSALEVYYDKIEGSKSISNPYIYWGNVLEPVIRNEFDELLRHYSDLWVYETGETKYHKDYKFLAGNVDGLICKNIRENVPFPSVEEANENIGKIYTFNPNDPIKAILEIKTAGDNSKRYWGEENHDLDFLKHRVGADVSTGLKAEYGQIPENYYYQCIFYMAIYDLPLAYLVVKFGNDMPLKVYKIERDLELEKVMIDRLVDFWENNVLKGVPPRPRTAADVIRLFPKVDPKKVVTATNEICDKSEELNALKEAIKERTGRKDELANDIKAFMQDAKILIDCAGNKMHSKSQSERTTVQGKLLKEKRPEIFMEFSKTTTVVTLR